MFAGDSRPWFRKVRRIAGSLFEYSLLLALAIFHLVNNWIYLSTRVTIRGLDSPSHLRLTLAYSEILQEINLRTLFEAVTRTAYRPPLPWLPTVALYRLFGQSDDVAVMSNSIFLVILLFSVYGVGKKMHSQKLGLLSAFLVSTSPILFNLSRTPYPDYPLVAMVACAICCVVCADGFRHRGYSLLLGLSLGLGMLTKQSFIAFVGAPLVYVAVKSGAIKDVKASLRRTREARSHFARLRNSPVVHVLVSLMITLLWYLPNRDYVGRFYLGNKLFFCYWLLLTVTFYVLSRRPSQGANLLGAAALGSTIASVWYLPRILSFRRLIDAAYSGRIVEGKAFSFLQPWAYIRYLSSLATEQLGPMYFAAFVLAVVILGYQVLRGRRRPLSHNWLSDDGWVMALWLVIPYLVFTLSLTDHSRYITPLVPAAVIVTAVGLWRIRSRVISGILTSLLVLLGTIQFFALSFDSLGWIREMATVEVPLVGEVNSLAHGAFIWLPASGPTDSGYFVLPDLLDTIRSDMTADGRTEGRVALLMRASYLNDVTFSYVSRARGYSEITLSSKLKKADARPLYERAFGSDYVVLWNTSTEPPTELGRLSRTILRNTPSLFREVFTRLREYTVPNGDVILLYKKQHRLSEGYEEEAYRMLGERIELLSGPGDAIILDPYEQVEVLGRYYSGQALPCSLAGENPLDETGMARDLQQITSERQRVFAVFWPQKQSESRHFVQQWLDESQYSALEEWYDGIELRLYETSYREGRSGTSSSIMATLGENISLLEVEIVDGEVKPGDIVRLSVHWQAREKSTENYKVFLHLLDGQDRIVAQRDSEPVGGSRPTTSWQEGELIVDNLGVLVPQDISAGTYRLVGGMYQPTTGQRLAVAAENRRLVGDHIVLGSIRVEN